MNFDAISPGSAIFVDANLFVYYFEPHPVFGQACQRLFQRIENNEIEGFTSSHVLSDVVHRVMTLEAANLFKRPMTGMANWLKQHPNEVMQLTRHRFVIDDISLIGIQILPVTGSSVSLSADISKQFGLLNNDALVVSLMQHHGLTHVASNDADLDRVPGLKRYSPA